MTFSRRTVSRFGIDIVEAAAIPYHGIPRRPSKKAAFELWDKMIGDFFTYMGTSAMCYLSPKGQRLAYQSATGYCSSIKVYFTNKFRNETPIPVFQPEQWKKLRDNLSRRKPSIRQQPMNHHATVPHNEKSNSI